MNNDNKLDEIIGRAREPVPTGLVERIESRILARRRRRHGAALCVLLAGGSVLWVALQHPPAPTVMDAQPPIIPATGLQANAEPTRVDLAPGFLGQPLETTSPSVTIIRVFERYTGASKAGAPVGRLPGASPAHRTT